MKEIKTYTPSSYGQYIEGVGTLRSSGGDIGGGAETLVVIYESKSIQSVEPKCGVPGR